MDDGGRCIEAVLLEVGGLFSGTHIPSHSLELGCDTCDV